MPAKQKDYLVTDASIYTVHPVVTEHRVRVIEKVEPLSDSGEVWAKIIAWVFIFFCFLADKASHILLPAEPHAYRDCGGGSFR